MQSVREPVFNLPGHSLPVRAIGQPIRTMAYIGPGSHIGYSLGKRVDIAIDIIQSVDMAGDPVFRQLRLERAEMQIDLPKESDMDIRHHLSKIWYLANFPEQAHCGRVSRVLDNTGIKNQLLQGTEIVRLPRPV